MQLAHLAGSLPRLSFPADVQQRVALARAPCEPQILLLDEPLARAGMPAVRGSYVAGCASYMKKN